MTTATTEAEVVEIRKNVAEVIRVERREFQGIDLLHVRVWYDDGSGNYKPSPKGLSLRPETWRELVPLIQQALPQEASDEEDPGED